MQRDHVDPVNSDLVCGLDNEFNWVELNPWDNNRKNNRFVPYRVETFPAPKHFGDFAEFLVEDQWVVCEFGSETWWNEANRLGNATTKGGTKSAETNRKNQTSAFFDPEIKRKNSKKAGLKTAREKTGLHSPESRAKTAKLSSERAKQEWAEGKHPFQLKPTDPRLGGNSTFQQKKGVFAPENLGKGAKNTNTQLWECLETGRVLPPGPLTRWQRKRNVDTSKRKRVK